MKDVATDEASEDATTEGQGRCTVSGLSTFSTDYLVICGRAFARPMDAASATLEVPSIALVQVIQSWLMEVD